MRWKLCAWMQVSEGSSRPYCGVVVKASVPHDGALAEALVPHVVDTFPNKVGTINNDGVCVPFGRVCETVLDTPVTPDDVWSTLHSKGGLLAPKLALLALTVDINRAGLV